SLSMPREKHSQPTYLPAPCRRPLPAIRDEHWPPDLPPLAMLMIIVDVEGEAQSTDLSPGAMPPPTARRFVMSTGPFDRPPLAKLTTTQ
ncbi:MAG: hypothetical protein AAFV29_12340, partial [Myxococcota bacterium]